MSATHADQTNAPQPPAPLTPKEIADYLEYSLDSLLERRVEILTALKDTAKVTRIDDDDTLGNVAENVKMALALDKTAEARRKENKEPFLLGGRAVDGWFKSFAAPIEAAVTPIRAVMDDYGKRKLARERAAAEAARKLAEAEAARAAEFAAALMAQNKESEFGSLEWAFDAAQSRADEATRAAALADGKAADLTRHTGVYGTTTSMRSTWGWDITDAAAIPRSFLKIDEDAIKEAAKQRDTRGKPIAVIPGLAWVENLKVGIR